MMQPEAVFDEYVRKHADYWIARMVRYRGRGSATICRSLTEARIEARRMRRFNPSAEVVVFAVRGMWTAIVEESP